MKNDRLILHGKFKSIMALSTKLEKAHKTFGTGERITSSEIHLMEIIGDSEDVSVTDIAGHLGITKGAVSQSIKRLEKKGFVIKKTDPANRSRAIVLLTTKGQTAYWSHKHWHETMDGGFLDYLNTMDDETFKTILDFLTRIEEFLSRRIASKI